MRPPEDSYGYSSLMTKEDAIAMSKLKDLSFDQYIRKATLDGILRKGEREIIRTRNGYVVSSVFSAMYVYIHVNKPKRVTYANN